jgi:hypothetical protein
MTISEESSAGRPFRTGPLVIGAALAGAGGVLIVVGMGVGISHLVSAARQRVQEMPVPPSEVARLNWVRAKAAAAAGVTAWQNGTAEQVAASS